MIDIQNLSDSRDINIQKAGVKHVFLPMNIIQKNSSYQTVTGEISLSADLSKEYKGTHMSRFMEILHKWSRMNISSNEIRLILEDVLRKLEAKRSEIIIRFRYFIEKTSPKSRLKGMMDYVTEFRGIFLPGCYRFILGVEVPVNTVCPCSKEISEYGAHNQRAIVRVRLEYLPNEFIWLEDLISEIEKTGSCEIFPVIKRNDEKHVTESAYDNPKFVEDVIRDLVTSLRNDHRISWFEIECEASESIHNHNAFAYHNEFK